MKKIANIGFVIILFLMQSCKNNETSSNQINLPKPSVDIVYPVLGEIQENIQINGQVVYLNKTVITAPISGYVSDVNIKLGDWVKKGRRLFSVQTKESNAFQNAKMSVSNEFGIIPVYASASGFVNVIDVPDAGVFIAEGNAMATIVKDSDLAIQVNVPFQYSKLFDALKIIEIELPNKDIKAATFYKAMPLVDPVSQTQQVFFKLKDNSLLPENLNVIVKLPKDGKKNVVILPKNAILTNETQDEFWIMKVMQDSLAVKILVIKGLESDNAVEIVSPLLKITDAIIQKGGYGLPDSTKVKIN